MKKILLLLTMIMTICASAFAAPTIHDPKGKNIEIIKKYIAATEAYYKRSMPDVNIYIEYSDKDYENRLRAMGFSRKSAKTEVGLSWAVTQRKTGDVVISFQNDPQEQEFFDFLLCHEFVHVYQVKTYSTDVLKYVGLCEGQADLIAGKIAGYEVGYKDHGLLLYQICYPASQVLSSMKEITHQRRFFVKYLWDRGVDIDSPMVEMFMDPRKPYLNK